MSTDRLKITTIVAVYNGASTLQRCLDSFFRQTYPDKEIVVIDGGSTDGTVDILKANSEKLGYWESEPDRGIYHAWNKGLEHASGDWICFIGADDAFWSDDVFERMVPALETAQTSIRVVYGKVAVLDKNGEVLRYGGIPWRQARRNMRYTLSIPHIGTMHHRGFFDRHGRFDEQFRIAGDYDMLLRELKDGEALFIPDLITVGFQHGGLSNSPRAMPAMLDELRKIYRKHGIVHPWTRPYSKVSFKMALCAWSVRLVGEDGFRRTADAWRRLNGKRAIWR